VLINVQVMRCEAQGLRVDIFALAVVMWECLTGSIPWKDMEMVQIILKVSHENNNFVMPPPGRPHIDDNHRANAPHGWASRSSYLADEPPDYNERCR